MGLDLGQIIQIAANVGVIAGIVFLALEIRQNNDLLAAQAREALHASKRDINLLIASTPALADVVNKANRRELLTGSEELRLEALQRSVLVTMEWQFEEFRRGRLSLKDLKVEAWRTTFAGKGTFGALHNIWEKWKLQTTPEFVRFIEEHVIRGQ